MKLREDEFTCFDSTPVECPKVHVVHEGTVGCCASASFFDQLIC